VIFIINVNKMMFNTLFVLHKLCYFEKF